MDPRFLIYPHPQDSPPPEEEEHTTSEDSPSPEEEEEYTALDSEDSSSLSGEHSSPHSTPHPQESLLAVLCCAVVTCFLVGLLSVLIPILVWGLYHPNHE